MDLNVTHTMNSFQFESRENLKNSAKNILSKNGASKEVVDKIIEDSVFSQESKNYYNPQLAIIKASSQITMNNSLKETLKYLKSHAAKKIVKQPVLGEIWDLFNNKELSNYDGELLELEIDYEASNIFAA